MLARSMLHRLSASNSVAASPVDDFVIVGQV
jgi:hypothetical protein